MAKTEVKSLKVIPLGGLDGIGKNMTAFEYGDDMILIDAGIMFPDDDMPGVDLVLPDYTYVLENEEKLRGIIVTHGHEDHTGAMPYLLQDLTHKVPIFSSKLTLKLIEGKLEEHRIKNPDFREVTDGSKIELGEFTVNFFSMTHYEFYTLAVACGFQFYNTCKIFAKIIYVFSVYKIAVLREQFTFYNYWLNILR